MQVSVTPSLYFQEAKNMSIIKNLKPELLWKHFDEISKIPHCSKHEEKIREYVLDFAEKQSLTSKTDKAGNVVVIKKASSGMKNKPAVVLQSHLDMVCEKNSDVDHDFLKDPIQLKIEGDVLTAVGTTLGADNGIGVAITLAILEDKSLSLGTVEGLFTMDEETGLTGAFALDPKLLSGKLLINLDSEDWGVITVGCAGGGNSTITLPIQKEKAPADFIWFKIRVTGLRGGHSGIDILDQRGNAIKLLARLLWLVSKKEVRVVDIMGGDKHNAIPRESSAMIGCDKKVLDDIKKILDDEAKSISEELKPVDPKFSFSMEKTDAAKEVLSSDAQHRLINLMNALPHGIEKMSYDIEGLVETSTNFAKIEIDKEKAEMLFSSRSSVMSALEDLRHRIHSFSMLAGGSVEEDESYPGWKPDLSSPLLELCKKTYKEMTGDDPVVEAIHAGLECGIIGEKIDGMKMVSIGPTINYPHSPEEQVLVSTVEKFYEYVLEIIKNV
jgi:dipeptidase D